MENTTPKTRRGRPSRAIPRAFIHVQVEPDELSHYKSAAERDGSEWASWVRGLCDFRAAETMEENK